MHPVLFRIPGADWPLHSYGVLIVCGFLLAMFVGWREARRHDPELGEEVTRVALEYGLVSSRTSFVAVDSKSRTAGEGGSTIDVPVPVPPGVRYETTVGRK